MLEDAGRERSLIIYLNDAHSLQDKKYRTLVSGRKLLRDFCLSQCSVGKIIVIYGLMISRNLWIITLKIKLKNRFSLQE